MPNLTLRDMPADIHVRLQASAAANFRSLTQEAYARLQLSFDLEEAAHRRLHQEWIDAALAGGLAQPADRARWQEAEQRGLARAKTRQG